MASEIVKEQIEILKSQQREIIARCAKNIGYYEDSIKQLKDKISELIIVRQKAENTLQELETVFPSPIGAALTSVASAPYREVI